MCAGTSKTIPKGLKPNRSCAVYMYSCKFYLLNSQTKDCYNFFK